MMWLFSCGVTAALALELGSAWLLLVSGQFPALGIVEFLLAHGAACLMFGLSLPHVLPVRYRSLALTSFVFIFATAFFIPVLGMPGLILGLLPALYRQQHVQVIVCSHPIPALPERLATPRRGAAKPGVSHLAGFLHHAADPQKRREALIATLALDDRHAVPLLRMGLKDRDDEVRRLAHVLLNRKEKAIETRIRDGLAELSVAEPEMRYFFHKALAHDYWELASLGSPRGGSLMPLREHSRVHAHAGLKLCPQDAALQFLLGRILLHGMDLDAAGAAFEQAREAGIDARKTMPFLAEIAFLKQRFSDIGNCLGKGDMGGMGGMTASRSPLNHVFSYWGDASNGRA